MQTFWLSFCDRELPEGSQFLGACVVEVEDGGRIDAAANEARKLGINPGGEVLGFVVDPETAKIFPARWRNKLLNKDDCAEMDEEIMREQAASGAVIESCMPDTQLICAKHNQMENLDVN
jgi:hypothetical protein